jgi:hypothetical protein
MAVVKKNGNPISLMEPQVKEKMAESIGAEINFLVGKRAILRD